MVFFLVPKFKNSGSRGRKQKLRVILLLFNIYNSSFQREAQTSAIMVGFLEQNMNTKVNLEACLTKKQGVCHTCGLAIYNKKIS